MSLRLLLATYRHPTGRGPPFALAMTGGKDANSGAARPGTAPTLRGLERITAHLHGSSFNLSVHGV